MTETDAQWASRMAKNRRDRDRRRERRADDPMFRAQEAVLASRYRARQAGRGSPFEALHCSRCRRWWHRLVRVGHKPGTCPTCRRQARTAMQRLRRKRLSEGVCPRCTEPLAEGRTLCEGCGGDRLR